MIKKKNIQFIILFLIMIELSLGFLMYKSYNNKNIYEDKTINNKVNRKRFAMYKLNNQGEYEEITNTSVFPEGYILNVDRTICVDNNGEEVTTNISSVNNKVMVTSGQTIYCTLYFDPKVDVFIAVSTDGVDGVASTGAGNNISLSCSTGASPYWNNKWNGLVFGNTNSDEEKCTLSFTEDNGNHTSSLLSTAVVNNAVDDNTVDNAGYRYEGSNPNNYIWFNNEIWRIIGLIPTKTNSNGNIENLVKIVRNDSIGVIRYDAVAPANNWNQTALYNVLNDYYYNGEDATNESECMSYQSSVRSYCNYTSIGLSNESKALIKNVYWNTGIISTSNTPKQAYDLEVTEQIYNGNVGLINPSDFGYATSAAKVDISTSNDDNFSMNNWLFKDIKGWTLNKNSNNANTITTFNNHIVRSNSRMDVAVFPVVFLDASVYILNGNGSESNPYIISK